MSRDLAKVRTALVAALALVDRLADPRSRSIDQQVIDLLAELDHGLTTTAICLLIRRRKQDVVHTIKLLAAAGQIARVNGRWHLKEDAHG